MSHQQKVILKTMQSDPDWTWTYAELQQALPEIAPNTLRKQVARLVDSGLVTRLDAGSFCLAATKTLEAPATPSETACDSSESTRHATAESPDNQLFRAPLSRDALLDKEGLEPPTTAPLTSHPVFRKVVDALPVPPMQAAFRLGIALAFVRSQLADCEAPALCFCGRSGTGKSITAKALCLLLHGNTDDVTDGDNLTTKPGVIGRREKVDGRYIAVPSVLLEPPERPKPVVVVIDEAANAEPPALKGLRTMLKLEPSYMLEGLPMPMSALLLLTWNKPEGIRSYWHPFGVWEGATRRLLICDMDYESEDVLSEKVVTSAARRVFGALEDVAPIDLAPYKARATYPTITLLEKADDIKTELFVKAGQQPLGDPVLKGLVAAYGALYGYKPEDALLASLADMTCVIGTSEGLLKTDAEKKLNARLRPAGLPTVTLPKRDAKADEVVETDAMSLSPEARARIAAHLARSSTKSTLDLLETLKEYRLARQIWKPIRLPRYCLEFLFRWIGAFGFGIIASTYNLIAPLVKLPRIGSKPISDAFGQAWRGPITQLKEWTNKDGIPLDSPRDYVLRLFGDDLTARASVELEDAAKEDLEDAA